MDSKINSIALLRKDVIRHFGKHIATSGDCNELEALLKKEYNGHISAQTLRRFFGLISSPSGPSNYTLNLLSTFCGFRDFESFSKSGSQNDELELFFGRNDKSGTDYWKKSEDLCLRISESPEMLVSTYHRLMSFPSAREYFIERHPMRDLLGTVYIQYFTAYLKYKHNNEAKIFVYGFLFHSAFLLQNTELMELYYTKVRDTELIDGIHVVPAGLKYGVMLLYADFIGNAQLFRQFFNEMKKMRKKYISASQKSVCSFEYSVLELLIFTNRVKEMKFLMDHHTPQTESDDPSIPAHRKQTHDEVWKILCLISHQKLANPEEAQYYLKKINLENLGVGWQKYYSILYYQTLLQFSVDDHDNIRQKLATLVKGTYFTYFEEFLKKKMALEHIEGRY